MSGAWNLRCVSAARIVAPYSHAVGAAMVGAVSWSGNLFGLLAAPLLVYLWGRAGSKPRAFVVAFCYYLAAGRGLVAGAGVFFGDRPFLPNPIPGLLLWTGYSAILAMAWGGLWGVDRKACRLLLVLVLVSIPPLGIVGGYNPLLAMGAFFPGFRWVGLVLMLCWMLLLVQQKRTFISALPFVASAILANILYVAPTLSGWSAHHTSLGPATAATAQYNRLLHLQRTVTAWSNTSPPQTALVLPELVGDDWSMNATWWERIDARLKARDQTVFLGAFLPLGTGAAYENVIVVLGNGSGTTFRDRVPVPISMWKPWSNDGAVSFWGESGVKQVKGLRVASLICYEQLLIWPAVLSMLDNPDVLIAPANDWWATKTNLPELQQQSVQAWSRAFAIPSFWSTNR